MFAIAAIVLALFWVVGVAAFHATGGALHLLLPLAGLAVVAHFVQRRRLQAARRASSGEHGKPPLRLRSGDRGHHYIVS